MFTIPRLTDHESNFAARTSQVSFFTFRFEPSALGSHRREPGKLFPKFPSLEGVPASLSPQAENRERGETEPRWKYATACHFVPCPENIVRARKPSSPLHLRRAVPSPPGRAHNDVPRRTAYRWAGEPAVRAAVESYRRRVIDRAVGRMASRATWAADMIAKLAKSAKSESVRLSALRPSCPT